MKNMTDKYAKKQKPPQNGILEKSGEIIPKTIQDQKEKNKSIPFSDTKLSEKEQEAIYGKYFKQLNTWSQYAKEFIDSPFVLEGKNDTLNIDIKKLSSDKKVKFISAIVNYPYQMDIFYMKARIDMHEKHHFEDTNCASYAGFVSTFSKLLNPENDVVIYFGTVIITKSPIKEEINKYTDHF
jgi:hypothetical protein